MRPQNNFWRRLFFTLNFQIMKIIQTLWINETNNSYENKAGWYAPEYHWMAWALSCLQLRQFYDGVELVTNEKGKKILIDSLQLPYTKVTIIQFSELTNTFWSLAKVEAYQLQNEPFLHVDGDVFIWQAFDNEILERELVAQNSEHWFSGYEFILTKTKSENIILPSFVKNHDNLESYNLGVVGGNKIDLFQQYRVDIFEFVKKNQKFLHDLVQNYNHSFVNMFIEQFMFTQLAISKQIPISTIFPEKVIDPDYPEITNFYNVPRFKKFVHLMGKSKSLPEICKSLSKILRRYYPEYYYRIIENCFDNDNKPTCQIYSCEKLSFFRGLPDYEKNMTVFFKESDSSRNQFMISAKLFLTDNVALLTDFQKYELDKINFHVRIKSIGYYYAKDIFVFSKLENLFNLTDNEFLLQSLVFDEDICLIENEWNWNRENIENNLIETPSLYQTLLIPDIYTMTIREEFLDSLNMILVDSFLEPIKIMEAIKTCALYYDESEIISDDFIFLIRQRIRDLMYFGALKWI